MDIKLSLHVRIARKYCQAVENSVVDSKYLKMMHIVAKIFILPKVLPPNEINFVESRFEIQIACN